MIHEPELGALLSSALRRPSSEDDANEPELGALLWLAPRQPSSEGNANEPKLGALLWLAPRRLFSEDDANEPKLDGSRDLIRVSTKFRTMNRPDRSVAAATRPPTREPP